MKHRGSTVIELLIVATLMSIIAATSIRVYSDSVEDARVQQTVQSLRTVHRSAQALRLHNGTWPMGFGTNFPEFDDFLGPSFLGSETPIGGTWYWAAGTWAGKQYAIVYITFPSDTPFETCQRIDALIDDGASNTGNVFYSTGYLGYAVEHWL